MSDLIKRDAALRIIYEAVRDQEHSLQKIKERIEEVPEGVVRCKDCKYWNPIHKYCDGIGYWFGEEDSWDENGFCYKGEKKDEVEE